MSKTPYIFIVALYTLASIILPSAVQAHRQERATAGVATTIAQVERDTERVRGLHAMRPVAITILSPAAFKKLVARVFDRDTSASDIQHSSQLLTLLGLLSPRANLRDILRASETANVAAFYDPRVKRFFIPVQPGGLTLSDQVTISHEYTHALQDQAFDLQRVRPAPDRETIHNSDRYLAETALIEGDATVEMLLYAQKAFTQIQYLQFLREAAQAAVNGGDHIPRYLLDQLVFPYQYGAMLEEQLLHTARGASFAAINKAFHQPPTSTREILHPDLYQRYPRAPAPDLAPPHPRLPAPWRRTDSDVLGQYELQDLLAQHLDVQMAAHAADLWRADRYSLFNHGSAALMAWRLRTDSTLSAHTLAHALVSYMAQRFHTPLSLLGDTTAYMRQDSAFALRISGPDLLVVLSSRGSLYPLVRQALSTFDT